MAFPDDFIWGAAAASYQIEGGAFDDGKGPSVWDMFVRKPHAICFGDTGDVACDHYHRWRDDVAMMNEMGLQAYRMSISWPRVLPEGVGKVNEAGLAFYDRLVDALLAADVEPCVTLFHWDYPLALFQRGGWLNRESVDWFGEYTQVVVDRLGDRVRRWFTINEPQVFLGLGHKQGEHAPGLRLPIDQVLRAAHHVLMAHGKAVQTIRARATTNTEVSIAPIGMAQVPYEETPECIEAARQATWVMRRNDTWTTAWWMDPVYLGHYPQEALDFYGDNAPEIRNGDMELIAQPVDFCAFNCYFGMRFRPGPDGKPEEVPFPPGYPRSAFGWPIEPACLYWAARFLYERYKLPILITENGMADLDWVNDDGEVHDPQRIDFTMKYLRAFHRAAAEGVPLKGYFHWSVMDNFEWAEGYTKRFGLVHVDYRTLERTLKESALWYREVIATNGDVLLD